MRYNQPCVCGRSSSGRARPCQGRGSEFEPRRPLQKETPSERMVFLFGIWQRAGLNSLRTPRRSPSCQPPPARCRGAAAGTLPRNRLASSAAGGASALSSSPAPKNKTTLWVVLFFGMYRRPRLERARAQREKTCRRHVLVPVCVSRRGSAASEPRRVLLGAHRRVSRLPPAVAARQPGHFLETASLHPPQAALRRFPRRGRVTSPTRSAGPRSKSGAGRQRKRGNTFSQSVFCHCKIQKHMLRLCK